ncbi:MAG: tyrosine-protein kinase family protein, partial [Flavobacteriales bacterium]
RKPKAPGKFNLTSDKGISNFLIGAATLEEIFQPSTLTNLDFVLSGPKPPNPAELLMSDKMNDLFAYLREHYEYVILDTPPLGLISDALALMPWATAMVYVVRQNYTRRQQLETLNKLHREGKLKHISIVL